MKQHIQRGVKDYPIILLDGQSLSVGLNSGAPLTTASANPHYMFNATDGVNAGDASALTLTRLGSISLETLAPAMGDLLSQLIPDREHKSIGFAGHGISGAAYAGIRKSGTAAAYANGLTQVTRFNTLNANKGKRTNVRAIVFVHGESDTINAGYYANIKAHFANKNTDLKNITKQSNNLVMIIPQMSTWYRYGYKEPISALMQLKAIEEGNGIFGACPGYPLSYSDGIHLTSTGYRQMGRYCAYVYWQTVIRRNTTWKPLVPTAIEVTQSGSDFIINATFNVPDGGALTFDTTTITATPNQGFEVIGIDGSTLTPSAVTIIGSNVVRITVQNTVPERLRYAYTGIGTGLNEPAKRAKGNLRSTNSILNNGIDHWWCWTFDKRISRPTITVTPPAAPTATGLLGWWESDSGITESGGRVTQWVDKTASAIPMIQATVASQPVMEANSVNGLPAVNFTASTQHLRNPLPSTWTFNGCHAFAVVNLGATTSNFTTMMSGYLAGTSAAAANTDGFMFGFLGSVANAAELGGFGSNFFWRGAEPFGRSTPGYRTGEWVILEWMLRPTGTAGKVGAFQAINGLLVVTEIPTETVVSGGTIAAANTATNFAINSNVGASGTPGAGLIARYGSLMVYANNLTAAERATTLRYLMNKYNISANFYG